MNNVYYRFVHLASNAEYGRLPARLRMQVVANPGVEKLDFELWSLAVSAMNGCGACIDSHEQVLRAADGSAQAVQDTVRIAPVVHGIAAVLDAEAWGRARPAEAENTALDSAEIGAGGGIDSADVGAEAEVDSAETSARTDRAGDQSKVPADSPPAAPRARAPQLRLRATSPRARRARRALTELARRR